MCYQVRQQGGGKEISPMSKLGKSFYMREISLPVPGRWNILQGQIFSTRNSCIFTIFQYVASMSGRQIFPFPMSRVKRSEPIPNLLTKETLNLQQRLDNFGLSPTIIFSFNMKKRKPDIILKHTHLSWFVIPHFFLYLHWKSADMTKHFILPLNPFSTRRFVQR